MPIGLHFLPSWHTLQLQGQFSSNFFPDNHNRRWLCQTMDGEHKDIKIPTFEGADEMDFVAPLKIFQSAARSLPSVIVSLVSLSEPCTIVGRNGRALTTDGVLTGAPDLLVVPGRGWLDGGPKGVRAAANSDQPWGLEFSNLQSLPQNKAALRKTERLQYQVRRRAQAMASLVMDLWAPFEGVIPAHHRTLSRSSMPVLTFRFF
jgi:hypothetical protein